IAGRSSRDGSLRIRTHIAFVDLEAVRDVAGHNVIRRDSLLDPICERSKAVPRVRTWPFAAVPHTGKHEESNLLAGSLFITVERRFDDLLVVVDCRLGRAFRIGPSVVEKKFPTFADKKT